MSGNIYFLESDIGLIKIGSSIKLETRIFGLALSNAGCLRLLGYIPAKKDEMFSLERSIHAMFESSRMHGEWFNKTAELETFIAQKSNTSCDKINRVLSEIYRSPKDYREAQHVKACTGGGNRSAAMDEVLIPRILKFLADNPNQDTRSIFTHVQCSKSKCQNVLARLYNEGKLNKDLKKGTRGRPNKKTVWCLSSECC